MFYGITTNFNYSGTCDYYFCYNGKMKTWQSNKYQGHWSELDDFYKLNEENKMKGLLSMSWQDFSRALVIAVIVAVASYVLKTGDLWALDWHVFTNSAVMAGIASILTSLGTTKKGNFAGAVPVEK